MALKLYIWNNPYRVSYGGSFLFVVAKDEQTAREIARSAPIIKFGHGNSDGVIGNIELGEPRIIDKLPYGECYEWYE